MLLVRKGLVLTSTEFYNHRNGAEFENIANSKFSCLIINRTAWLAKIYSVCKSFRTRSRI